MCTEVNYIKEVMMNPKGKDWAKPKRLGKIVTD